MKLEADVQTIGSSTMTSTDQRGGAQGSRRTLWIVGSLAVAGLTTLALGANWIAFATLVPLLYVLPCAALMFMCMKGMNNGPKSGSSEVAGAAVPTPAPSIDA